PQADDVAERLRHLLARQPQHPVVHPDPGELTAGAPRLRDLVLVVRENEVEPAAVDLEDRAEELLRHRRALDVPARPAGPPRRLPERVLALLVRLPEREVARILLQLALLLLLGRIPRRGFVEATGERAVVRVAADAEVDVAARGIGEVALDQVADQRDDLLDRLARLRLVVGSAQTEQVRVLDVPARRVRGQPRAVRGRGAVDLVVDVRDVLDEVHAVAAPPQPVAEPHRDDERPRVADVDALVDGRPAEVHADLGRRIGEVDLLAVQGAVEPHRPSITFRAGAARARARPRRARATRATQASRPSPSRSASARRPRRSRRPPSPRRSAPRRRARRAARAAPPRPRPRA